MSCYVMYICEVEGNWCMELYSPYALQSILEPAQLELRVFWG